MCDLLPNARRAVKLGVRVESPYIEDMKRLLALVLILPALAHAQDNHKDFSELYPPMKGVEYYCTDSTGQRVDLGNIICITASCTTWMARCEMSANNNLALWRKLQDGCPGATLLDRVKRLQPAAQTGAIHPKV